MEQLILNVNDYLERIHYRGGLQPTRETLVALHRAHLLNIPYENLEIHLGGALSLELEAIYEKIVIRHRGGWCYEMNGLLAWALRELGFDVTLMASHVVPEHQGDGAEGTHLILKVGLERPYLADVGFGNGFLEPIPLEAGTYQQDYLTYKLEPTDIGWFFTNHAYGGAGYDFTLTPRVMGYFAAPCQYLQTSPESGFVRTTVCHRHTPEGIVTLRGAMLREVTARGVDDQIVDNAADYEQLLNSRFDLRLPPADTTALWQKVWARHEAWMQENAQ